MKRATRKVKFGNVVDWATKAAEHIVNEWNHTPTFLFLPNHMFSPQSIAHVAAVIAHHAEPLVALLWESKREHIRNGCFKDEFNSRVDAALAGLGPRTRPGKPISC